VAAPHAVITSYAAANESVARVPVRQLMAPNITLRFMLLYTLPPRQLRDAIERTTEAVAAGALTTLPIHRFTLEQIAEAHDAVENGAVGKVVIDLQERARPPLAAGTFRPRRRATGRSRRPARPDSRAGCSTAACR
jgi:hypothetical protein